MATRSGKKNGMILAVFVGAGELVRAAGELVDMMRYDRCYPRSLSGNTNSVEEMGWLIFYQPPQPGYTPGFTLDRWRSFGYRALYSAPRETETISGWLSDEAEQVLRSKALAGV